jgi:flavonoid 3'-monooxygenase
MRKVCAVNIFSARALDDLRGFREREATLMVRSLADAAKAGTAVAVGKAANVCTTNGLSRAAVGLRVFGSDGARDFKEIVLEVMEVGGVLNVGDFVPALRWLDPQGVVARMKKLHRRFDDMMNGIIAERRTGAKTTVVEEGKGDLLGLLLAMVQEDKSLTGGEGDKITDTDVKALILVITLMLSSTSTLKIWNITGLQGHTLCAFLGSSTPQSSVSMDSEKCNFSYSLFHPFALFDYLKSRF